MCAVNFEIELNSFQAKAFLADPTAFAVAAAPAEAAVEETKEEEKQSDSEEEESDDDMGFSLFD